MDTSHLRPTPDALENLFRRLLAANDLGLRIEFTDNRDAPVTISGTTPTTKNFLTADQEVNGFRCIADALGAVDERLSLDHKPSLLDRYFDYLATSGMSDPKL